MNSVLLSCKHPFYFHANAPDDLTFCFRCDDYRLPENYTPRTRRSRASTLAPEGKILPELPYTPVREPGKRILSAERPGVVKRAQALAQEGYTAAQIGKAFGVNRVTATHWLTEA